MLYDFNLFHNRGAISLEIESVPLSEDDDYVHCQSPVATRHRNYPVCERTFTRLTKQGKSRFSTIPQNPFPYLSCEKCWGSCFNILLVRENVVMNSSLWRRRREIMGSGWRLYAHLFNTPRKVIKYSTRSSSLVTLARPSTSSSLRITDHSFQYASPRLWNQLLAPLRQPRTNPSNSASPSSMSGTSSIGSIDSPLSSSITPSLFHSRLKTFLFCKSFPP